MLIYWYRKKKIFLRKIEKKIIDVGRPEKSMKEEPRLFNKRKKFINILFTTVR